MNIPKMLRSTPNVVANHLDKIRITVKIKTEADAESIIYGYLKKSFKVVAQQYSLGGFRGHKIDIDIGDGEVGVEVKLAKSLLANVSEIYRCLGQAILYKEKKYDENLIMVIVGTDDEIKHHEIDELTDILAEHGIQSVFIECQ